MKIVIFAVGNKINDKDILIWLDSYAKSNSSLEPILIYDKNVSESTLKLWPYEKRLNNIRFDILHAQSVNFLSLFLKFTYVDILKVSAFKQVGECLVLDLDTQICKPLTKEIIPDCSYGLVAHHPLSSFFNKEKQYIYNVDFENYNFMQWVNTGVQIQRENILSIYLELFHLHFQKLNLNLDFVCFAQAIAGLTLRQINGVYLQPEWNWYYNTKTENNNIIIKHYYGSEAKKTFRELL